MDFAFGPADEAFRTEAREWLDRHLTGGFAAAAGHGGPGAEHQDPALRRDWERELGRGGWIGIGWDTAPGAYGNRTASLTQQVVWAEEYARVRAPGRCGHIGEKLLAPTLLAYGNQEQRDEFLPSIARGETLWCQGYSEPGAGSDLAGVRTVAERDGDAYRISGQKIWTSLAHEADWCFVLARTGGAGARRHEGLSFLLVPMDQPGRIEVRPIRQLTGTAEFNEVFFDGARARVGHVVGGEGAGWRVAMGLLGFERGVSTLAQQIGFAAELAAVVRDAVRGGATGDPVVRDQLIALWGELRVMRWNALRTLGGGDPGAPSVAKLLWGGWHQRLGELAVRVRGALAAAGPGDWSADAPYELDAAQRLFLFSRADTIYGGSDEIQRNIIAERVLGLPREAEGPR
ncbi:acyl-CoA dehydrogenase family protein [Streptomyces spectabilis]|uniref:Acyl-CoA dehydrogenase n=1 Tax=Streptomyces spectabilis TaxID=68270 RepID=A0A5P2XDL7_STRST|nr:acyl-CoA dehydrogenase family protein [Streptomyces spectabilis]MBB5106741.1 alkylation response protein AidB-like acyl-CoA dehydrogenase [Streptomyces spectabilis]MCI3903406.1 acyl-CoA dehydrogenase family protein [Streptomyces spectabilis]QEV60616.1 acyl-CoA dehydrogenase [Streptomyces spectabilis]GGV43562.1 acyl-CoA dehydrogenase [Streptomyces spectabilis]